MKLYKLSRYISLAVCIAASTLGSARFHNVIGACIDSSENIYTASYYPSSSKFRVSKRDKTGSTTVWVKDINPPSGYKFDTDSIVRLDSSGNVFVATTVYQTSGSNTQMALYKMSPSGALLVSKYYNPNPGYRTSLAGMVLDNSGYVYAVGSYGTDPAFPANLTNSFILQYDNSIANGHALGINSPTGYNTYVTDLVADASGNVYAGGVTSNLSGVGATVLAKYGHSTFTSGATWTNVDSMPSGYFYSQLDGCLTLDSSNRLTYLCSSSNGTNALFGTQRTTSGTLSWTNSYTSLTNIAPYSSIVDSSGNIIAVGTWYSGSYYIIKIAPGGTLTWSTNYSGVTTTPQSISIDTAGSILVADAIPSGSTTQAQVQIFNPTTGVNTGGYYYVGTAGSDYGYQVFASPTTAGVLYVAGIGKYGTTYYPMTFKIAASSLSWIWYQTATTP